MTENPILTSRSQEELGKLQNLVPGVETEFLVETALSITAALYEKSANGAVIRVQYPDGKAEELRFKVKKPARKSSRKEAL